MVLIDRTRPRPADRKYLLQWIPVGRRVPSVRVRAVERVPCARTRAMLLLLLDIGRNRSRRAFVFSRPRPTQKLRARGLGRHRSSAVWQLVAGGHGPPFPQIGCPVFAGCDLRPGSLARRMRHNLRNLVGRNHHGTVVVDLPHEFDLLLRDDLPRAEAWSLRGRGRVRGRNHCRRCPCG